MPKVGNFFIGSKVKMFITLYSYILSNYEMIYSNNCYCSMLLTESALINKNQHSSWKSTFKTLIQNEISMPVCGPDECPAGNKSQSVSTELLG